MGLLLEGKVALITGAGRGIGKAVALKFASEGARIAFTEIAIDENVKQTEREIEAAWMEATAYGQTGSQEGAAQSSRPDPVCRAYQGNVASFEEAEANVKAVLADFGRIDILVNNAGITRDGLILRMGEQAWDSVLGVNLKGAFNFIHAVIPAMASQRSGSIINMSSVVGVSGSAGQANYSASKAGLIGLAKSVAKEMGPRGIRANCIAPGFIISDMTKALGEEKLKEWEKTIPLRRGGSVDEVAKVALFLASDLSSYVSGQVISCCGAMNC